jgi:hypothetical protein
MAASFGSAYIRSLELRRAQRPQRKENDTRAKGIGLSLLIDSGCFSRSVSIVDEPVTSAEEAFFTELPMSFATLW